MFFPFHIFGNSVHQWNIKYILLLGETQKSNCPLFCLFWRRDVFQVEAGLERLQNHKQSRLERMSGDQLTQPLCSAATGFSRSYLFKFFKSPSRETLNVLGQPVLLFSHSYSDFKKTKQKLTLSSISCTSGNTSGPCA